MLRAGAAILLMTIVIAAIARLGPTRAPPSSASSSSVSARATCSSGASATDSVVPSRDAVVGPLVLIGARQTVRHRPDAFNRHGYKIPVTLPEAMTATLSLPKRLRGRVGFVFSHRTQDRVWKRGVKAADTAVRFTPCRPDGAPGRTGWAGGVVVDRRRCATLIVTVAGQAPVRRRVPLGRRCPA